MDRSYYRSPFTDLFANLVSHQWGGPCQKMEMDLVDCMEVYGLPRSQEKCTQLYKDFKECSNRKKQDSRVLAMMFERDRQIFRGERAKGDYYSDPPAFDSYDMKT